MNDPIFKQKYQKCKYKIKLWENKFKKEKGRIPSKHDIREAPNETRHAYKTYYQLKTSLLENTLNEALFEDDDFDESFSFTQSEMSSQEIDSLELQSTSNELINSFESTATDIMNDINRMTNFEESEKIKLNNAAAWGSHLNNKTEQKKSISPPKTLKSSINTKLFGNMQFNKRNPRKSISKSSSTLSIENINMNSQKEVLPDLETILNQKLEEKSQSIEFLLPTDLGHIKKNSNLTKMSSINKGWLDRCHSLNDINKKIDDTPTEITEVQRNYGISNLNIRNLDRIDAGSLTNLDNNTTSFGVSKLTLSSQSLATTDSSILTSIENIYEQNVSEDDSDAVISNSDDERNTKIRPSRHVLKKRKILDTISNNEIKSPSKPIQKPVRSVTKNKKIIELNSDETEEDPYACDGDSDKDPEYVMEKEEIKSIPKTKKRTIKTLIKKSKEKVVKIAKKERTKISTRKKRSNPLTKKVIIADIDKTEEQIDYLPEFGLEKIQNIPNVDINELKNNTKLFKKFVQTDSTLKGNAAKKEKLKTPINSNEEKLRAKINAGTLNENFVRVNLRKKVFVRGKKVFNLSRYKKGVWKTKKAAALAGPEMNMGGCDGGVLTCFQCGAPGHFAQQCKVKGENLLPIDAVVDDSPFPTLQEASSMANNSVYKVNESNLQNISEINNSTDDDELNKIDLNDFEKNDINSNDLVKSDLAKIDYIGHVIPHDFIEKTKLLTNNNLIEPIYKLNANGSVIDTPPEVYEALHMFGHTKFLGGQEKAVMRILSGQSTLVTLSTGSGKSLCYQLPAYLYSKHKKCITLVISPLVSLMEDQIIGVPHFLNAQCLHTNQTPKVREKTIEMIKSGQLDVLLISPEAVVAGEKSSGFGSILRQLPPIAFVCIDEAHCVSQWSHNFRPSYLMICRVLKEKLKVKTILGLTATATLQTRESIVRHLEINDGLNGVISDIPLPNNLILSVSKDANREAALINLLRSERFSKCQSIIVYCTRRDECERISAFLRTCLQDNKAAPETTTKKRKRCNWNAEPYHAGMPASRRRTIQKAFMSNELRIVVATVAFGMGINKSDIRAVIHFNMSKSFESYVQEVGRAGRDGKDSQCHLFLDSKGNDQNELRRHIFSNSIDRHVIRKLLQKIFVPCACKNNNKILPNELTDDATITNQKRRNCPGHEVCFSIEATVQLLDIPEENISTLLCYLELHNNEYIQVLSRAYTMCKVSSYGGPRQLKLAAQNCPPLAMAIALDLKKGICHDDSTFIEFPVIEIASAIGWDSGVVKFQLKNMEWTNINGQPKRSSISVIFSDLGFRVRAPGNLLGEELDETLNLLYERVSNQEKAELIQLQCVFESMTSVAFNTYAQSLKMDLVEPSNKLKTIIRHYFQNELPPDTSIKPIIDNISDAEILSNIRTLISRYPENNFTGRSIARIFHGCQSPNYPAVIWGRSNFWRSLLQVDFNRIMLLANSLIVKMKT